MARRRGPGKFDWRALEGELNNALECSLAFPLGSYVTGRLRRLEGAFSHDLFLFHTTTDGRDEEDRTQYLYRRLKPRTGSADDAEQNRTRLQREALTLQALQKAAPDLPSPRFVCFCNDRSDRLIGLIETLLPGTPLSKRMRANPREGLAIMGQLAARVHALPATVFPHLPSCSDAKEHVLTQLRALPRSLREHSAETADAAAWIKDNAPRGRRVTPLHGDLLPQNIQCDESSRSPGLVDWEHARVGDPAYDLAIILRGIRRPFGVADARERILAAYHEAGGRSIGPADIACHELLLVLHWLWDAVRRERRGTRSGQPPEELLQQIRSGLCRVAGL